MYDVNGKKYLDFAAGIAVFALGYHNEKYNNALKQQIDKVIHTSNFSLYSLHNNRTGLFIDKCLHTFKIIVFRKLYSVPGDHGTTYGGNPLACAAANKVFELFEEEHILEHVPYLFATDLTTKFHKFRNY